MSRSPTTAIALARKDVRDQQVIPVSKMLRFTYYAASEKLGHEEGCRYAYNESDRLAFQRQSTGSSVSRHLQ